FFSVWVLRLSCGRKDVPPHVAHAVKRTSPNFVEVRKVIGTPPGEQTIEQGRDCTDPSLPSRPGNSEFDQTEHVAGTSIADQVPKSLIDLGIRIRREDLWLFEQPRQIRNAFRRRGLAYVRFTVPVPSGVRDRVVKDPLKPVLVPRVVLPPHRRLGFKSPN